MVPEVDPEKTRARSPSCRTDSLDKLEFVDGPLSDPPQRGPNGSFPRTPRRPQSVERLAVWRQPTESILRHAPHAAARPIETAMVTTASRHPSHVASVRPASD